MSKKSRPTQLQMKTLVELLANDPQLCASKFSQTFTHKLAKQRWENIAVKLNAIPGAEKSGEKWKKTWQDTRAITKSKAAAIKRHLGGTGGGPMCTIELNQIQKETLPLISQVAVCGHSNSLESTVEFNFDDINSQNVIVDYNDLITEEIVHGENKINEQLSNIASKPTVNENEDIEQPRMMSPKNTENDNSISEKPSTSYVTHKPNLKRKITTAAKLSESSSAAIRLGDIAEKKCKIKEAYYNKKIKLLDEKNDILRNLGSLLSNFINEK